MSSWKWNLRGQSNSTISVFKEGDTAFAKISLYITIYHYNYKSLYIYISITMWQGERVPGAALLATTGCGGCLLASFANASTSLASNASPRPLPAHFATFSWAASRSPAHLATLCWAASCSSSAFCSLSGRPPCGVLCPYTERFLTNLFWRRKATLGTSLALNAFRRALHLSPRILRPFGGQHPVPNPVPAHAGLPGAFWLAFLGVRNQR